MADMMQNQFGLKPKMQGSAYTPPFPEWYYRVILPPRVKPPTEFTKFSGKDDTSATKRQTGWLRTLQAIEKIKKRLPWRCVCARNGSCRG
jgi:hypothetical protein